MFSDTPAPRLFGLAPGVDFPAALIDGLSTRMADAPPEAWARVELIVNTRRMSRRIRDIFDAGPPRLLPRVRLLTSLASAADMPDLPDPVPALRRRLELSQLIARLLDQQPDLAPRTALFDLADSLAALMDEMQGEGVPPSAIAALDVSDLSGHWERAQTFISIVQAYFDADAEPPDTAAWQRLATLRLIRDWELSPPAHPVILAGSTGSRGTTALLMRAVARLPQGAVVLPGFDYDMPDHVWDALTDGMTSEDHPQYRFARLMQQMELRPAQVQPWSGTSAPSTDRNRLVSLSLRPAPVTDQWLTDGPKLPDLTVATKDVTLLEAPTRRDEALAIAMRLRKAAEDGQTAALITPDRMLTRQVTSALDRWDIVPDDSAGTPLQLTPPGRFLRHVLDLFQRPCTAETLLTLLKHPLTHTGQDRNRHLILTRELELYIRRKGIPFPTVEALQDWADKQDAAEWLVWMAACFMVDPLKGTCPLSDWAKLHIARSEAISAGPNVTGSGILWDQAAGRAAKAAMQKITAEAAHGGAMDAADYDALVSGVLVSEEPLRDRDAPHPHILIWGTLEARVQGADLMILGGLNEGSWPELPGADPWLNRTMRHDAGLLLPERRIGLAAHDFQQAVAAPEVWMTRSLRSDDAETVASRWLNRLTNLMNGLPGRNGPNALRQMHGRGAEWLTHARTLEATEPVAPALRPSPCPPVEARPKQLSVTEIKRLIRDPYAIYARHVLRLRPLDPLQRAPDALLRGILLHSVIEHFVRDVTVDPSLLTPQHLSAIARERLDADVPWPSTRRIWQARLDKAAGGFVSNEALRQNAATPVAHETRARAEIPMLGFTLTAMADRIDRDSEGRLHIFDYKTGTPPSPSEQAKFDKQLLLEAAMATQGAFDGLPPAEVAQALYIGLTAPPKEVPAPLDKEPPEQVWEEFTALIAAYQQADQGFTARRAMQEDKHVSNYDQLSRFGEWDGADDAAREVLE